MAARSLFSSEVSARNPGLSGASAGAHSAPAPPSPVPRLPSGSLASLPLRRHLRRPRSPPDPSAQGRGGLSVRRHAVPRGTRRVAGGGGAGVAGGPVPGGGGPEVGGRQRAGGGGPVPDRGGRAPRPGVAPSQRHGEGGGGGIGAGAPDADHDAAGGAARDALGDAVGESPALARRADERPAGDGALRGIRGAAAAHPAGGIAAGECPGR